MFALFRNPEWRNADDNQFTLSPAVTLDANARYHIHLDAVFALMGHRSDDNAADDGSLNGWSFDSRRGRNSGAWDEQANAIQMKILGDIKLSSPELLLGNASFSSSSSSNVADKAAYSQPFKTGKKPRRL